MRKAASYRGYDIVETEWRTEDPSGRVLPVFVIPGMKERPSSPFLTSPAEAREYIDEELDAREEAERARTWSWTAVVRTKGNSLSIVVPSKAARILGIEAGDEVEVTLVRP